MDGKRIVVSTPNNDIVGSYKVLKVEGNNMKVVYFKRKEVKELKKEEIRIENSVIIYYYDKDEVEVGIVKKEKDLFEKEEKYTYGLLITKKGITKDEVDFIYNYLNKKVGKEEFGYKYIEDLSIVDYILRAESVELSKYSKIEKETDKIYRPKSDDYKNKAELKVRVNNKGEQEFVLLKGSKVSLPRQSVKNYSGKNEDLYDRYAARVNELYNEKKIEYDKGRQYIVVKEIINSTPSMLGTLVAGVPVSGWDFFEGLSEVKNKIGGSK